MDANTLRQEQEGVVFSKNERKATVTLGISGKDDYMDMIRALLHYVGSMEHELDNNYSRSLICDLIADMLPNEKQVCNKEFEKLESIKDALIKSLQETIEEYRKIVTENGIVINR